MQGVCVPRSLWEKTCIYTQWHVVAEEKGILPQTAATGPDEQGFLLFFFAGVVGIVLNLLLSASLL